MSGTQLQDAARRAAADVVNAFFDYNSPYGPGWRPCDGENGLHGGTPIAATITTASGSQSISVTTGDIFPGQPLSGSGIPVGALAAGRASSGGSTTMSVKATATGSTDVPLVRPRDGNLWMTALAVNADYWLWKGLGDQAAKQRIVYMASYLLSSGGYSATELGGDGTDGSANLLDDAGLKIRMLTQIYDVTADARYVTAALNGLPAMLRRFQGNNTTSNIVQLYLDNGTAATAPDGSPFYYYNHGAAYAPGTNSNPDSLQGINEIYEAVLATAAIDLYASFGASEAYYKYAYATYFRMFADYLPKSGSPAVGKMVFYNNYEFATGTSDQASFGYPAVGVSSISLQLSMMLATLAIKLRASARTSASDQATLLQNVKDIVAGIVQPQEQFGFLTSTVSPRPQGAPPIGNLFLPWEDSWAGMNMAAAFSSHVLTGAGVDPGNTCALAIARTAAAAASTRTNTPIQLTSAYRYTADWAGLLPNPITYGGLLQGYTGYEPEQLANPGANFYSLAGSQQIMTNVDALVAIMAGAMIEAAGAVALPNFTIPAGATLTDPSTGATLVDPGTSTTLIDG